MKIKSYYSRTVEEAMASARQELGPEAMLLNTRKTTPETKHLGDYEVVFAVIPAEAAVEQTASVRQAPPSGERLSMEVAELKRELESMRRALTRNSYSPSQWAGVPQDITDAYAALTAAEISPDLARSIVQAASTRQAGANFQKALVEELESRFTVSNTLGVTPASPRIVALVGPPGAGKTTTLVKLAVNYGLAARRGVLLLSMDTHRVAAADQLRTYAAILGVGFHVVETVGRLAQTIEENRAKDLILIDTPGLSNCDVAGEASLAHFLTTRADIDTHLVLPASMKAADLARVVDAFAVLSPNRLLFTRLDETGSCGPIFNEAARTKKPLSFFTTGQRIPEDLEAATRERLLNRILTGQENQLKPAA
jgi:flagellar biosynthesis protein FlhF